jgi:hypothetical protein
MASNLALRCCLSCHLVQEAERCGDCGAVTLDRRFLHDSNMADPRTPAQKRRTLGKVAWFVLCGFAGGLGASMAPDAWIGPVALTGLAAGLLPLLRGGTPVPMRAMFRGVAWPRGAKSSFRARAVGGERQLFRYTAARKEDELFAHLRSVAPFRVVDDGGHELIVDGVVHIDGPGRAASPEVFGAWADCLAEASVCDHVIGPDDTLEIFGAAHDEQASDGYRDRKQRVVRGTAAQPVVLRRV